MFEPTSIFCRVATALTHCTLDPAIGRFDLPRLDKETGSSACPVLAEHRTALEASIQAYAAECRSYIGGVSLGQTREHTFRDKSGGGIYIMRGRRAVASAGASSFSELRDERIGLALLLTDTREQSFVGLGRGRWLLGPDEDRNSPRVSVRIPVSLRGERPEATLPEDPEPWFEIQNGQERLLRGVSQLTGEDLASWQRAESLLKGGQGAWDGR